MKPPVCKLCKKAHWTYEEHDAGLEEVRELGASVLRNPVTKRNNVTPVTKVRYESPSVTKLVPTPEERVESRQVVEEIRRGRPKKHKTNAERKRAYRERSRG